jgi:hypothetical protein
MPMENSRMKKPPILLYFHSHILSSVPLLLFNFHLSLPVCWGDMAGKLGSFRYNFAKKWERLLSSEG